MEYVWLNPNFPTLKITEEGWTPSQLRSLANSEGCTVWYVPTNTKYMDI